MGTSLEIVVERRTPGRRYWTAVEPPEKYRKTCYRCANTSATCRACLDLGHAITWRVPCNYTAYCVLARGGGRGYEDNLRVRAISAPRELPPNRSARTTAALKYEHDKSWVTLRELFDYNWGQTIDVEVALWALREDAERDPSPWREHKDRPDDAFEDWHRVHPRHEPHGGVGVHWGMHATSEPEARHLLEWHREGLRRRRVLVKWTETLHTMCRPLIDLARDIAGEDLLESLPIAEDARQSERLDVWQKMTQALDDTRLVFGFG